MNACTCKHSADAHSDDGCYVDGCDCRKYEATTHNGTQGDGTMETCDYREIAEDYDLWTEYVDPSAEGTEEEFDAMTVEERIAFQIACFGQECRDE